MGCALAVTRGNGGAVLARPQNVDKRVESAIARSMKSRRYKPATACGRSVVSQRRSASFTAATCRPGHSRWPMSGSLSSEDESPRWTAMKHLARRRVASCDAVAPPDDHRPRGCGGGLSKRRDERGPGGSSCRLEASDDGDGQHHNNHRRQHGRLCWRHAKQQ